MAGRPYALRATYLSPPFRGVRVDGGTYGTLYRAVVNLRRWRENMGWLFGEFGPWLQYQVIDLRSYQEVYSLTTGNDKDPRYDHTQDRPPNVHKRRAAS